MAAFLAVAPTVVGAAEITPSGGAVVPGVWNSSFNAGKKYADENHLPMIVFYGKADCSECGKLRKALATDEFIAWQDEKKYVQVLSIRNSTPDWGDAQTFVRSLINDTKLPMIALYWNKADGTLIKKGFVGRNGTMPTSVKGTLAAKFMASVDDIFSGGGSPSPQPEPVKPVVPAFFNSAKTVGFAAFDADGDFAGFVEVKVGKANARKYTSKISATAKLLGLNAIRFGAKTFNVSKENVFVFSSANNILTLEFDGSGLIGTLTRNGEVFALESGIQIGGAMPTSTSVFALLDPPQTYKGSEVFTEWLPTGQTFSSGSRWTFPKGGTVKYNRTTGEFVNTGADTNASGVKLTYKPATGYFSGSFGLYYKVSANKAKKVAAKVAGYVVDGVGYGTATIQGVGVFDVLITAPLK